MRGARNLVRQRVHRWSRTESGGFGRRPSCPASSLAPRPGIGRSEERPSLDGQGVRKKPMTEDAVRASPLRLNPAPTRRPHHTPVFGIDFHGSAGGRPSPFWISSIEIWSGVRMKAMWPSRGGRLMTIPAFCSFSQ